MNASPNTPAIRLQSWLKATSSLGIAMMLGATMAQAEIVIEAQPRDVRPDRQINVPTPEDGGSGAGATKTGAAATDSVSFFNKDVLHGSLLGYDSKGIRWQSLEAKEPISFQISNVSAVKLDSHNPPANAPAATCAVVLTNDDELLGTLVSLTDSSLVLDTWYAGKLTIPRGMLKRISPIGANVSNVIYEGPTGMDGWKLGERGSTRAWSYRDGAFIGTTYGSLGRMFKLPSTSNIEFDLATRGNLQLAICFYAERLDSPSNSYMLQISSGSVYLNRYSQNGSGNLGESAQIREFSRKDKLRVGIRVNKEAKSIWLFINGKMVKQWTDTGDFAGKGGGVFFNTQSGSYTKISNIKVTNWDGKIDLPGASSAKSTEDLVKLQNQDKVSGKLKVIENGQAVFASTFAELKIPLDRIDEITLANTSAEVAKKNNEDIRAYFAGRGSVTFRLESWDAKAVVGSSPNFGKATFSPDAFRNVQFNLGRQQTEVDEPDEPNEEQQ